MSLRRFLTGRGAAEELIQRMETDKIKMDVIPEMTDEELQEYLPCKGDRVAVKSFAREEKSVAEKDDRKCALIESLRKRMGISHKSDSGSDDEVIALEAKESPRNPKKVKKSTFFSKLRSGKSFEKKQAAVASKHDRAAVVGFAMYDSNTCKYRQVRAPMDGGTRYPRVDKSTRKQELLGIVRPLFFPSGTNCHGIVDDFILDISTDVHGMHLMNAESVEDVMTRLKLKHFRCYLLAKRKREDGSDSEESLPDLENKDGTDENFCSPDQSSVFVGLLNEPHTKSLTSYQVKGLDETVVTDTCSKRQMSALNQEGLLSGDKMPEGEYTVLALGVQTSIAKGVEASMTQQTNFSFVNTLVPQYGPVMTTANNLGFDKTAIQPVASSSSAIHLGEVTTLLATEEYTGNMAVQPVASSNSASHLGDKATQLVTEELQSPAVNSFDNSVERIGTEFATKELQSYIGSIAVQPVASSSSANHLGETATKLATEELLSPDVNNMDDSGEIQFGKLPPEDTELDKTLPLVYEITVHRGRVCYDLINFFSQDSFQSKHCTTFEIKMLKEDGRPEAAEDSGGVMRDCLTKFWDTFYLQYTEGNTYKVPVLRHDMTDVQWKAVAAIIRMGFIQEGVYPIKLAPSFMQQAIFGAINDSDLIDSFLKFVSGMDKTILENALEDFESVEEDEINNVLEQYEAKKLINGNNMKQIVREIAHKELIQKPMFVADCFFKLLNSTPLVQEDMSDIYTKLEPSPKKVLKSLSFPEQMTSDETALSLYVKRLVREMDDLQYLELFLRFCTGPDIMTKKEIHIRFTSSDVSNNVRCPSAHTCGCVLEIPRSYAQDPYVLLKSDFLSLLKNRYWQMDIV